MILDYYKQRLTTAPAISHVFYTEIHTIILTSANIDMHDTVLTWETKHVNFSLYFVFFFIIITIVIP